MKTIDNALTEISLDDLDAVSGGITRGPAVQTWGQTTPGVRANEYKDGTLRIKLPKTIVEQLPSGRLQGITRRGELVLTPKAPYGH